MEPESNLLPMAKNGNEATPNVLRPMASQRETPALVPLRPMQTVMAPVSVTLTAMNPQISPTAVSLTAMVTPTTAGPVILRAMQDNSPVPPSSTVLTSMGGSTVVMRAGLNKGVAIPVEGLSGLAPLPVASRTSGKPLTVGTGPVIKPVYTPGEPGLTGGLTTSPDTNLPEGTIASPYQDGGSPNLPVGRAQLTDTTLPADPSIPTTQRPADQMLAVDVTINKIMRQALIDVYQADDGTLWLPLTDIAYLLEIPLRVNAGAGVAKGWYLKPSTAVSISMKDNKATVGEQTFPTVARVEKQAGDLYITADALKGWFNIDARLDYSDLRIYFTTPSPLPGDIQAKRYQSWDKNRQARERNQIPSDTIIPGYSKFSEPSFRVGLSTNFSKSPNGENYLGNGLSLQGENDIYGTNSQIALSFQQDSKEHPTPVFSGGNLLIQRTSSESNLLGPMQARYFGIGDINTDALPLTGISTKGRGIRVNNAQGNIINNPDQYILTGPAPIGWDVEAYQGQSLVAFARVDGTGIYRFTALPLRAGRNIFRIVMYGPNGEITEDTKTIYLGEDIPAQGQWQYDTAVFQPNQSVIPGGEFNKNPQQNALIAQAQLTTGLTDHIGASIGAFRNQGQAVSEDQTPAPEQGATVGLRGAYGGTYLTGDLFTSSNGSAWQASVRTPLTEHMDFRLTRTENMGFSEEERDELTRTQAEVNFPVPLGFTTLDSAYSYTRDTFQTAKPRDTFSQRTSTGYRGFNVTNKVDYTTQGEASNINGSLETSQRILKTSVRAGVNYQPTSPDLLRDFYVNTQVPLTSQQSLNLNYSQQLTGAQAATLGASTYWRTGPVSVGVQGQAGSEGNMSLGLNLATAFVPQGDGKGWKMVQPGSALGQGRIGIRVFADDNGNLVYDAGEALLPNVLVYHRQRGTSDVTSQQGIVRFNGLSVGTVNRFDIDLTTLPDIYLKPVSDTLNVLPHTGDNGVLNYAVRLYGEVSGQALTSEGQPLRNLTLTIKDAKGNRIDETITASDGFYTFGALPMGTYIITPEKGEPVTITITPKTRIQNTNLLYKKQTY